MSLEALSRVIQELFDSITALLGGASHHFHALLDRTGCAGSLLRRFKASMVSPHLPERSFRALLRHFFSFNNYRHPRQFLK